MGSEFALQSKVRASVLSLANIVRRQRREETAGIYKYLERTKMIPESDSFPSTPVSTGPSAPTNPAKMSLRSLKRICAAVGYATNIGSLAPWLRLRSTGSAIRAFRLESRFFGGWLNAEVRVPVLCRVASCLARLVPVSINAESKIPSCVLLSWPRIFTSKNPRAMLSPVLGMRYADLPGLIDIGTNTETVYLSCTSCIL